MQGSLIHPSPFLVKTVNVSLHKIKNWRTCCTTRKKVELSLILILIGQKTKNYLIETIEYLDHAYFQSYQNIERFKMSPLLLFLLNPPVTLVIMGFSVHALDPPVSYMLFACSGGSKGGGAQGTRAPTSGPKFLHFHVVFGKNWSKYRLPTPPWGWRTPLWEILDPPLACMP